MLIRNAILENRFNKMTKFRDLIAKKGSSNISESEMIVFRKLISRFVDSLNQYKVLPDLLTPIRIVELLEIDPYVGRMIIKKLNTNLRNQFLQRGACSHKWHNLENVFERINDPNGNSFAEKLNKSKGDTAEEFKILGNLIALWKKDQKLNTNVISNEITIEKMTMRIGLYIKKNSGTTQANALSSFMSTIDKNLTTVLSPFSDRLTIQDKIDHTKTALNKIERALSRDPNLTNDSFENMYKHPRNFLGLFKRIIKADTVSVKMLKSLQKELIHIRAGLEVWELDRKELIREAETNDIVTKKVQELYNDLHGSKTKSGEEETDSSGVIQEVKEKRRSSP